jgi:hypothetical protein
MEIPQTVAAVYDRQYFVNEWARGIPLLEKEGWLRDQKMLRSHL